MQHWKTPEKTSYLSNSESFTKTLKQLSDNQVVMHLLQEGWGEALDSEYSYLSIQPNAHCWVRDTFWTFHNDAWLLARVMIPYDTLAQDTSVLTNLGKKPIGELIYRDPNAKRERIQAASLNQTPYYSYFNAMTNLELNKSLQQQRIRRSILYFHQQPILIVELILDALDERLREYSDQVGV